MAAELNALLGARTVYSDGWVVDNPWLIKLFDACKVKAEFRVSALEMILSEAQMSIWHETKDEVIRDLYLKRHRASYDAYIIQETWIRTKNKLLNKK